VVSEVNGYTFGVWGLSGGDDGTTRHHRHHRDHKLLAMDAAIVFLNGETLQLRLFPFCEAH